MKLGSLFDGSGTCPLAASAVGIIPAWASEIEPFPKAVTQSRFPKMVHLGDITKMNGAEIEPVDVITFGSPCQNLSIAGNGKGLAGQESSLFFEAIRVIQEMRCATNGRFPQIVIWENVYGAFSSTQGEDFRTVIEALLNTIVFMQSKIMLKTAECPSDPITPSKPSLDEWEQGGVMSL